jgi:hypothetical protein
MEATDVVVEEGLVIGIDGLGRHGLAARLQHVALIPTITRDCKGIILAKFAGGW